MTIAAPWPNPSAYYASGVLLTADGFRSEFKPLSVRLDPAPGDPFEIPKRPWGSRPLPSLSNGYHLCQTALLTKINLAILMQVARNNN